MGRMISAPKAELLEFPELEQNLQRELQLAVREYSLRVGDGAREGLRRTAAGTTE